LINGDVPVAPFPVVEVGVDEVDEDAVAPAAVGGVP
jgi:hypothetical protein